MAYFTPTSKVTANRQKGFAYAVYEIFGSYFGKTECDNRIKEGQFRINFAALKDKEQLAMEDFCIEEAEKIFEKLPRALSLSKAKVHFIIRKDGLTEIRFCGEDYILRLLGADFGKKGYRILEEFLVKTGLSINKNF